MNESQGSEALSASNPKNFEKFSEIDNQNIRKTINQTIQTINHSITLASQTNLAIFDIESAIGKKTFTRNLYFLTILTAFFYVAWMSAMVWGACNTVQSHAVALSNLHGILIIPIMMFMRKETHRFERVGCAIILVACLGLILDRFSVRTDQLIQVPGKKYYKNVGSFTTDLYLLLSNIPAGLFFALNRSLMRNNRFLK